MRNITTSILLLFVAAIVGFIYLQPEWKNYREHRRNVAQLNAVRDELNDLAAERDHLKEKLDQIPEEDLVRLAQALPEGSDKKTLMVLLEALTVRDGVKMKNIVLADDTPAVQPSSQPQPGPFQNALIGQSVKELGMQLAVESSYPTFKRFLQSLEKSLRLIDVFDISFSGASGENALFTVKAKAYYQ